MEPPTGPEVARESESVSGMTTASTCVGKRLSGKNSSSTKPEADERPTAQRDDCLWLLRLGPDQVHRSP
ncbi:MAG: hypothetical protein WCP23_01275, partial [Planctomycetota bacterium]